MTEKLSAPLDKFKERELEILTMMAEGLSNQEIADQLFITKGTVRWYNKQIYSKLGTSRRTEAIALAREMGLIGGSPEETTTSQVVQHKLPITTGPFIGRDNELAELSGLLHQPEIRLLSLIAAGGMGKSRLSLELGHLIKGNYEHGAAFIDLTATHNPNDIATVVLDSLDLQVSEQQSPQDTLLNYCREKELLLIFDNFEHILAARNIVTDILEVAPNVTIIVSSRERLNLRVETVFHLQPIIDSGVQLFLEVASLMNPNLTIDDEEHANVQQIVDLVGGLPLALVLAATWVDTLSIAEIAEEIQRNLDFLSADMGDMPERQRSIHAVIDPTWKRLNEQEQNAFMWVSVFRGGFTRETFQQVTGASIRHLQTLLNRSLISHGQGRRYAMHPLLWQYAREKLESSGMQHEAQGAHLEAFLAYAETQKQRLESGDNYLDALEAFTIEQDNFRAALDWSLSGYETETGVALVLALARFWDTRSQMQEVIHYAEQATKYHPEQAELYPMLGFAKYRLGQVDEAEANIQQAISVAEATENLPVLSNGYRLLAMLHTQDQPVQEIRHLLEKSFEIAEASKSPRAVVNCRMTMAIFLSDVGTASTEVLEHLQKALEISEELGDLQAISRGIYNIAIEYHHTGEIERAKALCERSLALKRQIGDRAGIARRLSVLATWGIMEEEFEQALEYLAESRLICETLGEQSRLSYTLLIEGMLHLVMTDFAQAQIILQRGLHIAEQTKHYARIETCCSFLGLSHLIQGDIPQAKPYIIQALEVHHSIGSSWMSIVAYVNYLWAINDAEACVPILAVTFHHADDNNLGNRYFLQSLFYQVSQKIGNDAWQAAIQSAEGITIEQVFQEIVQDLPKLKNN